KDERAFHAFTVSRDEDVAASRAVAPSPAIAASRFAASSRAPACFGGAFVARATSASSAGRITRSVSLSITSERRSEPGVRSSRYGRFAAARNAGAVLRRARRLSRVGALGEERLEERRGVLPDLREHGRQFDRARRRSIRRDERRVTLRRGRERLARRGLALLALRLLGLTRGPRCSW